MRGTTLLLLCAVTLAQAEQPQLTLSGEVCNCNPNEAANVCSQKDSDHQLIVHQNCNQFYKCSNGAAVPYYCPANLVYNPLAELCDWPENVDCGERPVVEPDTDGDCSQEGDSNSSTENNENQNENGGTDDGNNGSTCNCNPEEAPAICAADGSDGVLVANQNCNQFYKCDHGIPVVLNCPSGLVYNAKIEQCDWAYNVDCGDRLIIEIEVGGNNGNEDCETDGENGVNGGENGDNGADGGNGNSTCNCNPGEAPDICATDGSDGVLIAHENCNQFYKCDHGAPVTLSCYPGLVYNPFTERCDWPANVDCGDKPIVEVESGGNGNGDGGSGNGNGNGDNGNGDNGTGGGTCNCNPEEAPGICASDGSDGTLIAHENCNQFYKCNHGVPITISCAPGLVYNPYTGCCDWPANVDCGGKPIVEIESGGNGNGDGDSGNGDGNGDNGTGGGTCNCNPEEAPGICAADGSDGTLIAHENCNQFYKCDHGAPVTLSCYPGLVYNPFIERCDWPASVDCGNKPIVEVESGGNGNGDGGSGNGNGNGDNGNGDNGTGGGTCNCNPEEAPGICAADGSDGTLIAHENCNQFYKCDHGAPVTLSCYPGLVYNPFTERCDWPANVDCGDKPIVEVESGGNGNGDGGSGNGDGNGDNGNGDNGTGGGTCNCIPEEAPGICAADGSDGTLIAHENCNQFYKCDHGVPVTISCAPGLVYNPYTGCCDWPANVDCGGKPIVEIESGGNGNGDGDSGNGDGNGDNGTGGGTCNCNPEEAPGICAADGSDGTLIAHENCNQFYKCDHGAPVTLSCYPGLAYNPFTERCDWPANVDCGDKPIVEVESGGNGNGDGGSGNGDGNGDNGNGDNGTGGGTCNCIPEEAPEICAADGSDGTLIAHENCNQFYKCDHGVPVTISCAPGLVYNPYTGCCDWPANVDCGGKPIVEIESGGNGNGDGDSGNGDGNGDNGNGDNGTGGGTCNCNPGEAPGICAVDGSNGTLIAHENCNQFYKCDHGVPVTISCAPGLVYNPYTECCDWPANVDCGDKPIVEIESGGNGNGEGDTGNGDGGSGDGNGENGTGGGTCNCNPGEAPGICAAGGSEGVLVAHENCNQFYKCSHGVPVTMNCNSNLLYNPYTERCDWPDNVECGDRPIVEIDGNGDSDNGGDSGSGGGSGDNGSGDGNGDNGTDGGTCNCNPGEAPSICAVNGSEGVLVAHENCNQFYKCSNGIPVALFCYSGLLYNPYTERCDWPYNVECGDKPVVEIDSGGDSNNGGDNDSGNENGGNGSGGNCDPSEAPAICSNSDSNGILVAHENCDQFYVCSAGLPVALSCPSNLFYNSVTGECDWPKNVECGDRVVPEPESDGVGGPCACDSRQAPAICAGRDSNGKLTAHENCNQYYVCLNGSPVAKSCPQSLFYEPHTEQCLWPASVNCDGRSIIAYSSLNKHREARRGYF